MYEFQAQVPPAPAGPRARLHSASIQHARRGLLMGHEDGVGPAAGAVMPMELSVRPATTAGDRVRSLGPPPAAASKAAAFSARRHLMMHYHQDVKRKLGGNG